jgi:Ca2+-binding EF-hand superfamily protein
VRWTARLPQDSAYTKDLFNLLDTDESGHIDFRSVNNPSSLCVVVCHCRASASHHDYHHSKFVVGMSSLNRKVDKQQIIELAFTAFDKEGADRPCPPCPLFV